MDLRNKRVVVVGLGTSGVDACLLLDDLGAIVSATENADNELIRRNIERLKHRYIETEIGRHTEGFLKGCDLMVVSPGVAKDSLSIRFALENNIPVISELELGFQFTQSPIIAITGTNGKSTVVSLIGEMLKKANRKAIVCGNIENSLSGEIKHMDKNTICVLEVSSFQLEWIVDFRPKISCVLNVTEDHLDRYRDFNDYKNTKLKIFSNQKDNDITILNFENKGLSNSAIQNLKIKQLFFSRVDEVEGIYLKGRDIIFNIKNKSKRLFTIPSMNLIGDHNIENVLAASLIALIEGVNLEAIETVLKEFQPLYHRMQSIGKVNEIEFIDDSKATNIDSTKRALESVDKKIILIAGGRDKGGDYDIIKDHIRDKVKKLFLIGEAAPIMKKKFEDVVEINLASTLEEATQRAFEIAKKEDIVLLSPMCSSFDMFRDYSHRGDVFRKSFEMLKSKIKDQKSKI